MLNYIVTETDWICSSCNTQSALEYEILCHNMRIKWGEPHKFNEIYHELPELF